MSPLKLPIRHRLDAILDLEEAIEWYEAKEEGLGRRFLGAVRAAYKRIIANPKQFAKLDRRVRAVPMKKFPYLIYFLAEPTLVVLAVLHGRRKASIWKKRI